jgi:hypothetical protein
MPPDLGVILGVERRDLVAHHAPHGLDQWPHALRHAQIHVAPPLGSSTGVTLSSRSHTAASVHPLAATAGFAMILAQADKGGLQHARRTDPTFSGPSLAPFDWADPFHLGDQLSEDERMVAESARSFAEAELAPRVTEAYLDEKVAPELFGLMGKWAFWARRSRRNTAASARVT